MSVSVSQSTYIFIHDVSATDPDTVPNISNTITCSTRFDCCRLDVLLNIKWTVNEFDCALTRDIVELIDREADLLDRGRSESTLSGLRIRLNNLFLQFIETPEFNPEASRFLKVPNGFEAEPIFKTLAAPSNWA